MINCLIFLLVFLHLARSNEESFFLKKEYSLTKPYQLEYWNILGHTVVTNNYIRLTPDIPTKNGHVWSRLPCQMHNWEAHIHFKVHGKDVGELHGDGIAFWYTRETLQTGPVFGSKDYFQGLSVLLDTYSNQNGPHAHIHPYISAMVNNGSNHYDHDHDGTLTELGGCSSQFRNLATETFLAVRYENNSLTISYDIEGNNKWTHCFTVGGVHLPTGYYFGATAVTGDLSDNHDIISIRIYELETPVDQLSVDFDDIMPSADFAEAPRDRVADDPPFFTSGIKRMLIFVIVVVTIGGVAFGLFLWYQNRSQYQSKRFY